MVAGAYKKKKKELSLAYLHKYPYDTPHVKTTLCHVHAWKEGQINMTCIFSAITGHSTSMPLPQNTTVL